MKHSKSVSLTVLFVLVINVGESHQVADAGKPTTNFFTIDVTLEETRGSDAYDGRFHASGAIHDGGAAVSATFTFLELYGRDGDLLIEIWDNGLSQSFTIINATGDYVRLIDLSGSIYIYGEEKHHQQLVWYYTLYGVVP